VPADEDEAESAVLIAGVGRGRNATVIFFRGYAPNVFFAVRVLTCTMPHQWGTCEKGTFDMKSFGTAVVLASVVGALLTTGALAAEAPHEPGVKADRVSKNCVEVHVAGRSGKIQVRGGGVHLIVEAEEVTDRESSDLEMLADKVAAVTCGNAAADKEEADAVAAADALKGLEVVHENTYGAED
jgi:hypothetical protein